MTKSPAEKRAEDMTDDELRIAIAEWCGWEEKPCRGACGTEFKAWHSPDGVIYRDDDIPNYPADLNAMWEAEETLKPQRNAVETTPWGKYFLLGLLRFAERENLPVGHLTAKHRAICFVNTIQNL